MVYDDKQISMPQSVDLYSRVDGERYRMLVDIAERKLKNIYSGRVRHD